MVSASTMLVAVTAATVLVSVLVMVATNFAPGDMIATKLVPAAYEPDHFSRISCAIISINLAT